MGTRRGFEARERNAVLGQPLGIDEFSFLYSTAFAVVAVGLVALVFGQCMMMGRIGRHWWQGLIPGYNLYLLFSGARLQMLFLVYLACGVGCFGFWMMEEPEIQDLIWFPIALGVLIVMYVSLALAQRLRLGVGWQVAAFFVPSYAWVLMGLTGARVDEDYYPWTVRPFIRIEHLIFRARPWEFDPATGKPFGEEEGEFAEGYAEGYAEGEFEGDAEGWPEEPFEDDGYYDGDEGLEDEAFEDEGFANESAELEEDADGEPDFEPELEGAPKPKEAPAPRPAKRRGRRLRRRHTMVMEALPEREALPEGIAEPAPEPEPGPKPKPKPKSEPEPEPARDIEPRAPRTTPLPFGEDAMTGAPAAAPASSEIEVHTMSDTAHMPEGHEETRAATPAFHGAEFDPVGDGTAEEAAESGADREIEDFVDEEAVLARAAEAKGGVQDDDLSDEVNSQLEGIYAEELGFPGVTQAVDDEEAVYMESDASIAREEILEETHDEPNPTGYQARHLAQVAKDFEAEEKAREASEDAEFEREKASYEAKHAPRHAKSAPKHAAPRKRD